MDNAENGLNTINRVQVKDTTESQIFRKRTEIPVHHRSPFLPESYINH